MSNTDAELFVRAAERAFATILRKIVRPHVDDIATAMHAAARAVAESSLDDEHREALQRMAHGEWRCSFGQQAGRWVSVEALYDYQNPIEPQPVEHQFGVPDDE